MTEQDDTSSIDRARDEVHRAVNAAPERARLAAKAEGRRSYRRSVIAAAGIALMVSVCFSAAAVVISGRTRATVDEQAIQVSTLRQIAEDARTKGDAANAELQHRGQTPVPIPPPGSENDSEVLVASAAARVLASLPDLRPTAAQLGAAVAAFFAANPVVPVGPTPQQISESLAGYLAVNPPPPGVSGAPGETGQPGAKGDKGDKGDPPTAEEIRAALQQFIRRNPNILCPRGGDFAQLRLQLADGRTADTWQCVVTVSPSSPPVTTNPVPGLPLLPTGR